MTDRKEKILTPTEVESILANHFGFPPEGVSMWFKESPPSEYCLRYEVEKDLDFNEPKDER